MGKKYDAPQPADPKVTSAAQTTSNIETAIANGFLNATNQNTPYGTVRYDQTGSRMVGENEVPQFTSTTTLNPQYQGIIDSQAAIGQQALDTGQAALGNVQRTIGQPFSYQGLPELVSNVGAPQMATGYGVASPQMTIAPSGSIQTSLAPSGNIQTSLDRSNLPGLPGVNDFSAERKNVEDAYLSRFNEDIGRREEDTISRLNAQGLQRGSEAYNTEMQNLQRARNDARNLAIQAGGAEQSRLFGLASQARGQLFGENQAAGNFANAAQGQQYAQNLGAGQFTNQAQQQQFGQNAAQQAAYNQAAQQYTGQNQDLAAFGNQAAGQQFAQALSGANLQNQARQQGISEQAQLRSQPINELASLLGFAPGIQTPQGPGFNGNVANTDVLGAYNDAFAGQMANYQQQMASQNALLGGLFGLGGAGIMKYSDRRLKSNIRRIGRTDQGLPIYIYTKDGKREVGVMAQDVEKVMPWAVVEMPNGFKAVNYEMVA